MRWVPSLYFEAGAGEVGDGGGYILRGADPAGRAGRGGGCEEGCPLVIWQAVPPLGVDDAR